MSPSASCARCARPLAADSAGELCTACRSADTATQSRHAGSDTRDFERRVLGLAETLARPAPDARTCLRAAPPGYDLLEPLDSGGMGEVFLAREQASERTVAMKFLRSPGNRAAVERFLVEVRALARLDHPHIVRVFATDFYRADPYFTMEYAPGGTLADRVEAGGPLAPKEAAGIVAVVARAVAAAHAADVLHRDIKPRNILLAADGMPKVSDFGLAKRTDRDDGLTAPTGPMGTPGFMPPEQVSSRHGEVGPASDVYGLGATLYHLLTGRAPFVGDTPAEVITKVETTLPDFPRSLRPDIPPGLEAVVVKCLEKKPADRYPSAAALADDLDRFLAGGTPKAPEQTRWRRARRWAGRNRARLVAAAAAVLLGVGLVAAGAALAPVPPDPKPAPDPAEEIRKDLAAGRPVTLVGETGPPKYHRFWLEPNTLGDPPAGDQPCAFHAYKTSMLELSPAPGIDRYQVELELRHRHSRLVPAEKDFPTDSLAFYFGHTRGVIDGTALHAMLVVSFKDYRSAPNPKSPHPPGSQQVYFGSMGYSEEQERFPATPIVKNAAALFMPKAGRPGGWRPIVAKVTPEEVTVLWRNDEGEMELLARRTGAATVALHREAKRLLDRTHPGAINLLPDWTPDLPFGVISDRASVEVRNVKVTPVR